ncbi:MAG: hypothetical protein GY851_09665 [bacterium]|nr:hypothetical protein [bacterium]
MDDLKRQPRIGLLPLYLKLYDETRPEVRAGFDPFLKAITDGFAAEGVDVVCADVCRVEAEFKAAVAQFNDADIDLIVTVHLAYSPSLESAQTLASAKQPVLMLDTTMDAAFGLDVDPSRIMYNHGIHGVQDLASMLRRLGKRYAVVAGHVTESKVLKRAVAAARGALAARCLKTTKALRVGDSFEGMGDFAPVETIMNRFLGIACEQVGADAVAAEAGSVTDADVDAEMQRDRDAFQVEASEDVHRRSVRVGLALRRLLEKGGYSALSVNFLAFDSPDGAANTMPFLEICKAMARGYGYAGEGDVLTAALVGALSQSLGRTTFCEVFCPDWQGGSLFLSHMGEINPEIAADKPRLIEKDFPWTPAENPAAITCAPAPGPAVLVNLAPGPRGKFGLIAAPVEVLGDTTNDEMRDSVRGWIKPSGPVETFLEQYSYHGGTHHSALVLGNQMEAIHAFAHFAKLSMTVL